MLPLSDLQARVRAAVVAGDYAGIAPWLVGGADARKRLAIHSRHYHTSLTTALLDRFPATVWLAGSGLITAAARAYVAAQPPSRPCIAEYGDSFPAFLASRPDAAVLPYLPAFAALEWHLTRLSLAVTAPPFTLQEVQDIDPARLGDLRLALQPDVHYVDTAWALDELMAAYLADRAPDRFELRSEEVWLELRGARGVLRMTRLDRATFEFRRGVGRGLALADAALASLEIDAAFDAGAALVSLIGDGLVRSQR